jgi:DNA-binding MarR family transcriptional regulator
MTTAQRLYNYITLLAVINIDNRPRLVTRSEGDPIIKTCPFAIFEDLKESAYLMEFSNGVRPYILEWYNDVFLVEFNDKRERNTVDNEETIIGVTTRELFNSTFRVKGHTYSTKQILENYLEPLINAGYIDKVENEKDKRSYQFYPVLNEKQKKLFDVSESTNFLQRKMMHVVGSTIFPNRNYLISKILGVLRYSYKRHKLTRLENNEGKEITVEELVDHYYKDPDRYFEIDNCKAATAKKNDGVTTATTPLAISRTL